MSYANNNIVDNYGLGPLGTGCPCDGSAVNTKFIRSIAPFSNNQRMQYMRTMGMKQQAMASMQQAQAQTVEMKCHVNVGNQIGVL